jgi:pimeloyl-ACP methyl ester carboxylesterase
MQTRRFGPRSAPKAICVHGFADDGGAFCSLEHTELSQAFEVIAPDLPGFGESPPLECSQSATIDTLATQVLNLIAETSPDRPVALIGHSIGSAICVAAALRETRRVGALLSIEGNLTAADAFFSGRAANYDCPDTFKSEFAAAIAEMAAKEPWMTRYLLAVQRADAMSMWSLGRDAANKGVDDGFGNAYLTLAKRSIPCLYLWGRQNTAPQSAAFIDRSRGERIMIDVELGGYSHWIFVDAPGETARLACQTFASLIS